MANENLEKRIVSENILIRQVYKAAYALKRQKIVLDEQQYCHIINNLSGELSLIEGPAKKTLAYDEHLEGLIQQKILVPEHSYCIISNPVDVQGSIQYGDSEVKVGPSQFSLHPGETIETRVQPEHVLTQYDAILINAKSSFDNHIAGEEYLVKGPGKFVPNKHEFIVSKVKAISLSDTDGLYVQNKDTGEVSMVKGPVDYFLAPNEQLYKKETTEDELAALGLTPQQSKSGVRVLTRQAANISHLEDRSKALTIDLEHNEMVFLYDGSTTRIEEGPQTIFLGPYERPKVLNLSGGKPIQPNALKIALVKSGPDFIYDQILVRTKDNAQLKLDVTYKWRFNELNNKQKIFSINDFVGYAAETLSSEIRSVVANHDFEDFHASALKYVKPAIFGEDSAIKRFDENGLEIFGIDITTITPQDPKIAEKLHEAIKSNMDIYCKKLVLRATLEAERQEVEGKSSIETERGKLINLELVNERKRQLEKANISSDAERIMAQGRADAFNIEASSKLEAQKNRYHALIEELNRPGAQSYIDLQKATAFRNAEKLVVVPSKSKVVLPFDKTGQ